jgi:hypothetical protein
VTDDRGRQRNPDFRTALETVKSVATVLGMEAESILGRRTARLLGILALFAVVVGVLLALLDWYIAPTDAEQKQALVVTLAQILGGAALLSGLYFTWRTLQVNREGQITDRFTRAIDQLGKTGDEGRKLLEIRLGGIYALERIARESKEDHWPIMEVLTAYIRQNAPRKLEKESTEEGSDEEVRAPDPDVQAIMTVLRRRTRYFGHGEPEPLDLHKTDLSGANLSKANLLRANFSEANFWQANLQSADLRKANLREVNLQGAHLQYANLQGAFLQGAFLQYANLQGAFLQGAFLRGADLYGALLQGVHLRGADLEEANLQDANLLGADLEEANLQGAAVTDEQLADARSLQGATMPDGSKHT